MNTSTPPTSKRSLVPVLVAMIVVVGLGSMYIVANNAETTPGNKRKKDADIHKRLARANMKTPSGFPEIIPIHRRKPVNEEAKSLTAEIAREQKTLDKLVRDANNAWLENL